MTTKKCGELRKKGFKERERLEREKKTLKWRTEPESHEEDKSEHGKRENAREATTNVRATKEEVKEETKSSFYLSTITQEINKPPINADKSFDLRNHKKAIERQHEINGSVEKVRSEAFRKITVEEKKRREEAKYFYCIIPFCKEKSFGNVGVNNSEVYTIPYRDVAAVVSDSPMKDYELNEDNVTRHGAVLSRVMEEHTAVPVEFGTTIKNEKILRSLMAKVYSPAAECLRFVESKVELGVKALLGKDIAFVDQGRRDEYVSDILASLSTIARQRVVGDLFSDRLILNASFLVDKGKIDAFSEKVAQLQEKYPTVKLRYSGPWAPYNFVYIRIGGKGLEVTKNR